MKIPLWVYSLLALAWSGYSTYQYYCVKCGCCASVPAIPAALPNLSTLDYRWNSAEAVSGDGFSAYKTGILAKGALGDTLVITGNYRKDETNNSTFANLGLARADAAKKLFIDKVPESRIRTAAQLVTDDMNKTDLHTSADFTWIKAVVNMKEASIIESGNETSILFPFGSAAKTANTQIDSYLAQLCEKHKNTSAKFAIVGHTDNVGDPTRNKNLGLNRANSIREVLSNGGINKDRITTDSKGQDMPVADNTTEEGRYQNRRVTITVTQ
jgi:OmpA-OmpF porin, OOP family